MVTGGGAGGGGAALLARSYDLSWSGNDLGVVGNVAMDHRVRPDEYVVADADRADDDSTGSNPAFSPDRWRPTPMRADGHALGDVAPAPDHYPMTNSDAAKVADVAAWPYLGLTVNGDAGETLNSLPPHQETRARQRPVTVLMGNPVLKQCPQTLAREHCPRARRALQLAVAPDVITEV